MKPTIHALSALLVLVALGLPVAAGASRPQDDVTSLVEELKTKTDNADADVVRRLANLKTRAALDGLLEVYGVMNSIYMRRAVLRGLALFDDVPGEEQRALEKMMAAATDSAEREMREIAVEEIARCRNYGKAFLAMIVESPADDHVRERAMVFHTRSPRAADHEWYLGIYDPSTRKGERRTVRDEEGNEQVSVPLPRIRELAFGAIVSDLDLPRVVEAARGGNRAISRRALQELDRRGDAQAVEIADRVQSDPREYAEDRLFAVDILLRAHGTKDFEKLIKEATRPGTSEAYALGLAQLLGGLDDPAVRKYLVKNFGKEKGLRKLFYLHAAEGIEDEKIDKTLPKLLKDKDPRIQTTALRLIASRRVTDTLPDLEKLLEKPKDPEILDDVFDTINALRAGESAWEEQLVAYASHEDPDIRNSAIQSLGGTGNPKFLPTLVAALGNELWSTRFAAARGLERLRNKEGVGALCHQIAQEDGRMALELGEILFRLTGKPFRNQGRLWERWWSEESGSFEFVTAAELRRLEREEEAHRLRQVSRTDFFGIQIDSTRVIFILDVSGSMVELTQGRYVGARGAPRIDVARRELARCLDSLETKSLFNMIIFSDGVEAWKERISEKNEETIAEAKAFVDKMHAGGSTNLHGALELAFQDPDVDTIFVLSDGEPTSGRVVDPAAIRAEVEEWNQHRGVKIHCIAVGGELRILEWIAQDTGGTYVKYR